MIENITGWLFRATNDLNGAVSLFQQEQPILDIAIYHTQQSAEKALKGFLAFHNHDILKTHDVVKLVYLCADIDSDFLELLKYAAFLTPHATEYRYFEDIQIAEDVAELLPEKEDVRTSIDYATFILNFVKRKTGKQ
ncbi:MAG: HEPN domain-containing protein [Planctomycetaceae bacterium]|jgi:HEPN domain-containing protein|nr:HEPN domain-containing protein [Planctomycetaceae bacterium]